MKYIINYLFFNRCDDLIELFNYANIKSDQLMAKIEERRKARENFECISQTIDHIVDSVCSSISSKLNPNKYNSNIGNFLF